MGLFYMGEIEHIEARLLPRLSNERRVPFEWMRRVIRYNPSYTQGTQRVFPNIH
jgi:hypothetical protein